MISSLPLAIPYISALGSDGLPPPPGLEAHATVVVMQKGVSGRLIRRMLYAPTRTALEKKVAELQKKNAELEKRVAELKNLHALPEKKRDEKIKSIVQDLFQLKAVLESLKKRKLSSTENPQPRKKKAKIVKS